MKFKKIIAIVCLICYVLILNEKIKAKEIESEKRNEYLLLEVIKNETNFVLEDSKLLLPCVGTVTSRYGYRNSNNPIVSKNHKGIDIGADKGTKIVAAHNGTVLKAETIGNYGKCVIIQSEEYVTLYAHCSKILVSQGDKISKGEKIAEVGRTR